MFTFHKSQLRDQPKQFERYIALCGEWDLLTALGQFADLSHFLHVDQLAARAQQRYAPDKWTVASVVQHIIDSERVFSYRALRIARGDTTPLPGFDQDLFAAHDNCAANSWASIAEAFHATRAATQCLYASLPPEALFNTAPCSGIEISAGSLGFVILGHQLHHMRVLRDLYGIGPAAGKADF